MTKKSKTRQDREKTKTFISDKQLEADAWEYMRKQFPGETDDQLRDRLRVMPVKEREQIIARLILARTPISGKVTS